jgi:hypothetical protein
MQVRDRFDRSAGIGRRGFLPSTPAVDLAEIPIGKFVVSLGLLGFSSLIPKYHLP